MKKLAYLMMVTGFYTNVALAISERAVVNISSEFETPITTINTTTLTKGTWDLSQRTEYYQVHPLSNATLLTSTDLESQKVNLFNYLLLSYGVTNELTLGASLPFLNTYQSRAAQPINTPPFLAVKNLGEIAGFSDLSLYALWRVVDKSKSNTNSEVALLFGATTPTGKTNVKMNTGQLFSLSDQPGHGSMSPFGGLVLSTKVKEVSLSANVFYTKTTKSFQNTILGSYLDYNLAAVYRLYKQHSAGKSTFSIDGILEINGEYMVKDKIAGIVDANSGYNIEVTH